MCVTIRLQYLAIQARSAAPLWCAAGHQNVPCRQGSAPHTKRWPALARHARLLASVRASVQRLAVAATSHVGVYRQSAEALQCVLLCRWLAGLRTLVRREFAFESCRPSLAPLPRESGWCQVGECLFARPSDWQRLRQRLPDLHCRVCSIQRSAGCPIVRVHQCVPTHSCRRTCLCSIPE